MSRPLKDTLTLVRTRLSQAGLGYENTTENTISAQCPICESDGHTVTIVVTHDVWEFKCENGCEHKAILDAIVDRVDPTRPALGAFAVTWTKDKTPKLILPGVPVHDDLPALLMWITSVFRLDPRSPATRVAREGVRGQDGQIEIRRAGAPAIRFEPLAALYSARRMKPMLGAQLIPTDDRSHGFKDEHCEQIAHVVLLAAGVCVAPDAAQEAAAIVGTFLGDAKPIEGHTTYGTAGQRYEAIVALRPETEPQSGRRIGLAHYLLDDNTGEHVIRAGDLQEAARKHTGSGVPRGWLEARMDNLGWPRKQLQGWGLPDREGRRGPHARCEVYRGHLPSDEAEIGQNDPPVNT